MSELKVHTIYTPMDDVAHDEKGKILEGQEIYLKSEADKVIADKDKELRHQKYKRCLAMSSYWLAVSYQCVDDKHRQKAVRHRYRWLELAKKFKEAK